MEKGALAQSQFDTGRLAEARKTINDAIADRDDIPELHLLRARIELQAKSRATAFSAYSNALSLDSSNMEALAGVAELGLQLGHLSESEDAADRILSLDPRQPNGLLIKGLHNVIKRHYADALANAEAILANSPSDEGASILKARALVLLGRSDDAFAVIEQARKTAGDTRGVAMTLLELYRERGNGEAMVPLLERLRTLDPADHELDVDEADTLYKLGNTQRARAILRTRILDAKLSDEIAKEVTDVWAEYDPAPFDSAGLAEFARKAGIPARKAVARFFLDRNDPASAAAALAGAPPIDDIVALRARIGVAQGRPDESLALAKQILEKDRTHCDALLVVSQVDAAQKRTDDAITAGRLAATTCPQLIAAHLVLVRAQELDGNRAGALVAFRDGFDRNPQSAYLARAYTSWLEQGGQRTRALAIVRHLTRDAPALLSGWKLYLDLCTRAGDASCTEEAQTGLEHAHQLFGVDPRTDELPSRGLFGRIVRK